MAPADMMIIFFFVLVTVKAVTETVNFWKEVDEDITRPCPTSAAARNRCAARTTGISVRGQEAGRAA